MFVAVSDLTKPTAAAFVTNVRLLFGMGAQVIVQLVYVQENLVAIIILALIKILSVSSFVAKLINYIILALGGVTNKFDSIIFEILSVYNSHFVVTLYLEIFKKKLDEVFVENFFKFINCIRI